MTFTIRRATPDDAEGIAAVHVTSIRGVACGDYTAAQIEVWSAGKEPQRYRNAMAMGEVMFVAISEVGAIVGFAGYAGSELRAVYVHPETSRRGVGAQLLAALEADALSSGTTDLTLDASINAESFYAAHGYVAGARAMHVFKRGGELECVRMSKRLG